MSKAIIVYGSTTGNTELLATYISDSLKEAGINIEVSDVKETDIHDMLDSDIILLGSSTWGDGELQEDFIRFYDQMGELALNNKGAAAFGCGNSNHEHFCGAVSLLEAKLRECGADILIPGLKIDGDVEESEDKARAWGKRIASKIHSISMQQKH